MWCVLHPGYPVAHPLREEGVRKEGVKYQTSIEALGLDEQGLVRTQAALVCPAVKNGFVT